MSADPHRTGAVLHAAVALLTVSDTRNEQDDRSGQMARALVEGAGHRVVDYQILPDEPDRIAGCVKGWLARTECEVVVLNGGTGISGRDRTYEAVAALFDKKLDGFGELFRTLSYEQVGSRAMLSRAVAGIAAGKPIFSLPGSTAAVELALDKLILPELGHLLGELRK